MPVYDVAVENEIILGGIAFPTTGPVRVANITVVPNPIVLGDASRQTETQVVSQFIQPDAASGIGVNRANARIEFDRSWTSEAETRYSRQITLPGVVTDLGCPAGETAAPGIIMEYLGVKHVSFGPRIYTLVGTTWTLERTLGAVPNGMVSHKDRLFVTTPLATEWKEGPIAWDGIGTTPGSWQVVPENYALLSFSIQDTYYRWVKYLGEGAPFYPAPVWSLRANAHAYPLDGPSAGTPSTPTPWAVVVATGVPLDVHSILTVATDTGRFYYYAATDGLYGSGGTQGLLRRITYQLPPGRFGRTACIYGNDLVIPTGELGLLAVRVGANLESRPIGLDQEDGVPANRWGVIEKIATGNGCFYALITHRGISDTVPHDLSVYAYDGHWHYIAGLASGLMTTTGTAVQGTMLTVLPDGVYVGHVRADGTPAVKRLSERVRSVNPKQVGVDPVQTRFTFAPGPVSHITPWYDFGSDIQSKLLLKLHVQCEATTSETIEIQYAVDLDDTTWIPLAVITYGGLHALPFNGPYGRQCRLVRFRYLLRRQAGDANAYKRPLIDFADVEYMRLLPATYGFAVEVDLTRDAYRGRTRVELLDTLLRLSDPTRTPGLIEFSYQDAQQQEPQTHFVRISRMTGQEWSGRRQRGVSSYMVSMMSPYHGDSI